MNLFLTIFHVDSDNKNFDFFFYVVLELLLKSKVQICLIDSDYFQCEMQSFFFFLVNEMQSFQTSSNALNKWGQKS